MPPGTLAFRGAKCKSASTTRCSRRCGMISPMGSGWAGSAVRRRCPCPVPYLVGNVGWIHEVVGVRQAHRRLRDQRFVRLRRSWLRLRRRRGSRLRAPFQAAPLPPEPPGAPLRWNPRLPKEASAELGWLRLSAPGDRIVPPRSGRSRPAALPWPPFRRHQLLPLRQPVAERLMRRGGRGCRSRSRAATTSAEKVGRCQDMPWRSQRAPPRLARGTRQKVGHGRLLVVASLQYVACIAVRCMHCSALHALQCNAGWVRWVQRCNDATNATLEGGRGIVSYARKRI